MESSTQVAQLYRQLKGEGFDVVVSTSRRLSGSRRLELKAIASILKQSRIC